MGDHGRNDLCPCGSGKKYKKCCLAKVDQGQVADFEYRRLRSIEAKLIPKLMRQAVESFGPGSIHEAWDEFNDYEPESEFDPEAPMNQVFMPWFMFSRTEVVAEETVKPGAPIDTTVAEAFLMANEHRLSPDERMILMAANRCPFSFCEVMTVQPGSGMRVRDLFRDHEFDLVEHTGSQALKRGEIVFCATMHLPNHFANISTGPYALPPIYKKDILELKSKIAKNSRKKEITDKVLREFDTDIRGTYLEIVKHLLNQRPQIHNTDGDPLVPQKVMFDIKDPDVAFQRLKDLSEGATDEEILSTAKTESGRVLEVEIPWLGGKAIARKRLAGPILLGTIKINGKRLTVEVNSNNRADQIRKEIEVRLGSEATYKTTLIEPIESKLDAMKHGGNAPGRGGHIPMDQLPPEALVMIKKKAQEHWDSWFDIPIPALKGKTPKQAAKTAEGRDLLNSLLLYYEQQDAKAPDNLFSADVGLLRKKLGL